MGFTKFTKNVLNVSALPDRVQNQASSLKLVFDQAGVDIKAALNALISELEAKVAAANIGADVASVTEKNVQSILTAFENEIANRYTKAETNNAILADTNELIADVKIDLATGLLTVTKKNGTKQTFETSTEAESYAVGGTGTRPGEDTDNAKYYAQIAKQVAGGDFVTVVEMEGYAQKKGLYPNYNEIELKGEVIETETTLEAESVLKVHGNSVQETRSGKNLFDSLATTQSDATSTLVEGNTIKVSISSSSAFTYASATIRLRNSDNLLGKTLTLSANFISSASNIGQIRLIQINSAGNQVQEVGRISTSGVPTTLKMPGAYTDGGIYFALRFYANTSGTATTGDYVTYSNVQLEEGSTATSYEPYGAMPSPEFESPIMSVKSKSDNLFDISKKTDNAVFTWGAGANYSSTGAVLTDYISTNGIKEISSNYPFNIAFYDTNKNYLGSGPELSKVYNESAKKLIIPNNNNIAYCRICYYPVENSDMTTVTDIMLNKGTTALPYQPYGYVPVEARVEGKNLFDMDSWSIFDKQNDGSYKSNVLVGAANSKINIDLPTDTYTLSYSIKSEAGTNYRIFIYYEDGTYDSKYVGSTGEYIYASFTTKEKKIAYMNLSYTSPTENVYIKNFMLNKGATALPYEPYKQLKTISMPLGDIELRSTPDGTRDTFVRVDGVWNVVGNIGKYSLDNTGDIRINEGYSSENYRCFYYNKTNGTWNAAGASGYTEKFEIITDAGKLKSTDKPVMFLSGGTYKQVFIKVKNDITTVDEFKSQIVNTPIDVIVPLATPTYSPITDSALTSALDELEQLVLHKGYNRITVTGVNGVKAQLELEIAPTALLTNISETEAGLNMPVPVVAEAGDVLVKVPKAENQMTINPATGVVNVKGLTINGVSLDAYIRSIIG